MNFAQNKYNLENIKIYSDKSPMIFTNKLLFVVAHFGNILFMFYNLIQ